MLQSRMYKERGERVPVGDRKVETVGIIGGRKKETVGKATAVQRTCIIFR